MSGGMQMKSNKENNRGDTKYGKMFIAGVFPYLFSVFLSQCFYFFVSFKWGETFISNRIVNDVSRRISDSFSKCSSTQASIEARLNVYWTGDTDSVI